VSAAKKNVCITIDPDLWRMVKLNYPGRSFSHMVERALMDMLIALNEREQKGFSFT
jgi:hypothetical protein